MLEYIFFDSSLSDKFITRLNNNSIPFTQETDNDFGTIQGNIISVSESIKPAFLQDLQDLYDQLQSEQEALLEMSEDGLLTNVAGMEVVLQDGNICTLKVDPEIVSKMLIAVSFEELQSFVSDITQCVQNPDNRPVCLKG